MNFRFARVRSFLPIVLAAAAIAGCGDDETDNKTEPLPDAFVLSDDTMFPEGTAFDAGQRAFFMGSLGHGAILRVDADASTQRIYEPPAGWSTLGMKISPQSGELVVCAVFEYGMPNTEAEIWSFDVTSGERTHVVPLNSAFAGANCNDVAFDAAGSVYVTDRENPNLYKVSLTSEAAEVFLTDPLLAPGVIGCNGIEVTADNNLLVGKYSPATLLRIPISDPAALSEVTLGGDAIGSLPNGFDGIVFDGDVLTVAGNSQVFRITSSDGWASAQVAASMPGVNIAALTVAEGRVYGLKGEIVAYVLNTDPDLPFELRALTF